MYIAYISQLLFCWPQINSTSTCMFSVYLPVRLLQVVDRSGRPSSAASGGHGSDHHTMTNGNGLPPAPPSQHRHSAPPPAGYDPGLPGAGGRAQYHTLPPGTAPPSAADAERASTLDRSKMPPPPVAPKPDKDSKKRHSVLGGLFKKRKEKEK